MEKFVEGKKVWWCPLCDRQYPSRASFGSHDYRTHGGNVLQQLEIEFPHLIRPFEKHPGESSAARRSFFMSCEGKAADGEYDVENCNGQPSEPVDEQRANFAPALDNNSTSVPPTYVEPFSDGPPSPVSSRNCDVCDSCSGKRYDQADASVCGELSQRVAETEGDVPLFLPRSRLPDEGNGAILVYEFFCSFDDSDEPVYPYLRSERMKPTIDALPVPVRECLRYCTENQYSVPEAEKLFGLLTLVEGSNPMPQRPMLNQFGTATRFSKYLANVRRQTVHQEGWRTAVIKSTIKTNRTGVFRPVLDLLLSKITESGGASAVIPFCEEHKHDQRVFSAPWNSEHMGEYARELGEKGLVVLVDLYSDSTTLSSSGTQSANNMRVRFSNVRGITNTWFEVGIVPTLDLDGAQLSKAALRREKNELWQRFTFQAFRSCIEKSHFGIDVNGTKLFPRLGAIVTDQVQERPSCGLKGHDSFFDCTHCLIPTRRKTSPIPEHRTDGKRQRPDSASSGNSFLSGYRNCDEETSIHVRNDCGDDHSFRDIQLSARQRPRRNVMWTIRRQVAVAQYRIGNRTSRGSGLYIKKYRRDLDAVSALDFPPSLSAFAAAGSYPYLFYDSVAYDKLHVNEHGIFRQITDEIHKVFEFHSQYNGMTKGAVVGIANQRIADIPRAAQMRRFAAFLKSKGEKLSGVTGKMRRELLCFLSFSVMGIPHDVPPDEDVFVTLLIDMDLLQRRLLGVNESPDTGRRTLADIQNIARLGFKIAHDLVLLLDCQVNTKIHRLMHHLFDHLVNFGCFRKGATDDNETMHKTTKKGYSCTNKKLVGIAPQLLSARVSLEVQENKNDLNSPFSVAQTKLLLTRNPLACLQTEFDLHDLREDFETVQEELVAGTPISIMMARKVQGGLSPSATEAVINKIEHPSTNQKVWNQKKSVRFAARFEWDDTLRVWQNAYAGNVVFNVVDRRDAISYEKDGRRHLGIIQAIFSHHRFPRSRVLLLRKLIHAEPEYGNRRIVEAGNKRFKYAMEGGDVQLDCISAKHMIRCHVLVPDPWASSRRYGRKRRWTDIPDTIAARHSAAFFEVAGYKHTALAETPFR